MNSRRRLLVSGGALLGAAATARLFAAENADLRGKVALVTGSTDGLGRAVALLLAAAGAHVIVHGRNAERGAAVVKEIKTRGRGEAVFHAADFASLSAVRVFARTVFRDHTRLDILINNAGIGPANADGSTGRQLSADDFELRFAVNYLAGYLLTRMLLPLMTKSAPARIVNVASGAQRAIDFENLMLASDYDGWRAYSQSKLAQVMQAFDLAEELKAQGVTANAVHPGTYMDTTMVRALGVKTVTPLSEGAAAVMNLAAHPALAGRTGLYFSGLKEARAEASAYDPALRAQLRAVSARLVDSIR